MIGGFEANPERDFRRQVPRDGALSALVQTIIEEQVVCGLDLEQTVPSGHVNSFGSREPRGGFYRRSPVDCEPGLEVRVVFEDQRRPPQIGQRREREQNDPDPASLLDENCFWQHRVRYLNLPRVAGRIKARGECVNIRQKSSYVSRKFFYASDFIRVIIRVAIWSEYEQRTKILG